MQRDSERGGFCDARIRVIFRDPKDLGCAGDRGGALKYFMKDMVGAPAAMVVDDASDAVDLAKARGRRAHASV